MGRLNDFEKKSKPATIAEGPELRTGIEDMKASVAQLLSESAAHDTSIKEIAANQKEEKVEGAAQARYDRTKLASNFQGCGFGPAFAETLAKIFLGQS
eukprot:3355394-Pyramimonas_sp.AAC.1